MPNVNPTIDSVPFAQATLGRTYAYAVVASDPDPQTLSYTLLQAPVGISINASSGSITGVPTAIGDSVVSVQASDGFGGTATQSYTLHVLSPPVVAASIPNTFIGALQWGATNTTYYHVNLAGSPVAATDGNAAVLWRETYKPYGEQTINAPSASENDIGFTGHIQDIETNLVYMGSRYYDPFVGRFMSVDPVKFTQANPTSFNRYAYANNNPDKYVDPDGELPILIPFFIGFGLEALNLAFEAKDNISNPCGNCVRSSGVAIPFSFGKSAGTIVKSPFVTKGAGKIGKTNPEGIGNNQIAEIIGWGKKQAGAEKALVNGISTKQINKLKNLGYTKEHINNWVKTYDRAANNPSRRFTADKTPVIRRRLMKNVYCLLFFL